VHGNRQYVVYWDAFTPEKWQAREAEYKAEIERQRALEALTVDKVNPGEEQNERDHGLKGERTGAGDFGPRKWRHAVDGGWFSWTVKVLPDAQQALSVTYWGSDAGERTFDVLVDGVKVATQKLQFNKPDKFYEENYELPETVTKGKTSVTVKFQGRPGGFAGGVFGLRVLRVKA
jgi:hypothetical protein